MKKPLVSGLLFSTLTACSASPAGNASISLEAEETITDGLTPGADPENVVDGWTVTFDQFVVAIGHVHVGQQASGFEAHVEDTHVIDLTALPATGFELAAFEGIPTGDYDMVEFETPAATAAAIRHESVSQADFDAMVAGGCTYLIAGSITNPAGERCPPGGACAPVDADGIAFRFCIPAETVFGPCENSDGTSALTVAANLTAPASITLHGDHLFFDSFPTGEEIVERRAQWLANGDTNGDGETTEAELTALDAAELFTAPEYSLAGAPSTVLTAWDFVIAQVKTQGHWNGEGECLIDGEGHDH
jgi:hypothetical protein